MDNWGPKTYMHSTSPYDGTEPVILLRPKDMHARPNHQPTMHSLIDLETYSYNNDLSIISKFAFNFNVKNLSSHLYH